MRLNYQNREVSKLIDALDGDYKYDRKFGHKKNGATDKSSAVLILFMV